MSSDWNVTPSPFQQYRLHNYLLVICQDALEYFQHFLEQVERTRASIAAEDPSQCFKFYVEERIMCSSSRKVKYTRRTDNVLSLSIPLHAAINTGEHHLCGTLGCGTFLNWKNDFPHHLLLSHALLVSKDCGSKCNGLHVTRSVELDFCNCLDGFWEWYCYASCRWSGSLSEAEGRERVGWGEAVSTFLWTSVPPWSVLHIAYKAFLPLPTMSWLSGDSWHVAEEIYTNMSCKIEMTKFWKMGLFDGTGVMKK